jgi:hypothetical protein
MWFRTHSGIRGSSRTIVAAGGSFRFCEVGSIMGVFALRSYNDHRGKWLRKYRASKRVNWKISNDVPITWWSEDWNPVGRKGGF